MNERKYPPGFRQATWNAHAVAAWAASDAGMVWARRALSGEVGIKRMGELVPYVRRERGLGESAAREWILREHAPSALYEAAAAAAPYRADPGRWTRKLEAAFIDFLDQAVRGGRPRETERRSESVEAITERAREEGGLEPETLTRVPETRPELHGAFRASFRVLTGKQWRDWWYISVKGWSYDEYADLAASLPEDEEYHEFAGRSIGAIKHSVHVARRKMREACY